MAAGRPLLQAPASLTSGAVAILATADPSAKASASGRLAELWNAGGLDIGAAVPPPRPARPERPQLRPPKEMPKRRAFGSLAGRIALLHAVAHIELNAIDLAWDIIARFSREALPRAFFGDWVGVAAQEAVHFELLGRQPELARIIHEEAERRPGVAARSSARGNRRRRGPPG